MWFPPIDIPAIEGRALWVRGAFLGLAAVTVNGAEIAGPLFRSGPDVFMLVCEQPGELASITFLNLEGLETKPVSLPAVEIVAPQPAFDFDGVDETQPEPPPVVATFQPAPGQTFERGWTETNPAPVDSDLL